MHLLTLWGKTAAHRCIVQLTWLSLAGLLLAGCPAPGVAPAYPEGRGDLLVRLSDLRSDTGEVLVSLFAGERGFPDRIADSFATLNVPIRNGVAEARFTAIPYGEYAVSVLHDEDGDGRMATGLFGAPREGFGFSGRPDYHFGQPGFAQTRFLLLSPSREIEVVIRYETGRREHQESGQAGKTRRPPD